MGICGKGSDRRREKANAKMRAPSGVYGVRRGDLIRMEALESEGCDLTRKRHVMFFLCFPHEDDARTAAEVLSGRGFTVTVEHLDEGGSRWTILAESSDHALVPNFLRETADLCDRLAVTHGGQFNDWEAGPDLE